MWKWPSASVRLCGALHVVLGAALYNIREEPDYVQGAISRMRGFKPSQCKTWLKGAELALSLSEHAVCLQTAYGPDTYVFCAVQVALQCQCTEALSNGLQWLCSEGVCSTPEEMFRPGERYIPNGGTPILEHQTGSDLGSVNLTIFAVNALFLE